MITLDGSVINRSPFKHLNDVEIDNSNVSLDSAASVQRSFVLSMVQPHDMRSHLLLNRLGLWQAKLALNFADCLVFVKPVKVRSASFVL